MALLGDLLESIPNGVKILLNVVGLEPLLVPRKGVAEAV